MSSVKYMMRQALMQAYIAYSLKEVPVGVIIVKNKLIVAKAYNQVERLNNPLMHAELLAISLACKAIGSKYLDGCDMYVTLEPCHMCSAAISLSRIDKVFYGPNDEKYGGMYSNTGFFYSAQKTYQKPEVYAEIMSSELQQLIKFFFLDMRSLKKDGPNLDLLCQ